MIRSLEGGLHLFRESGLFPYMLVDGGDKFRIRYQTQLRPALKEWSEIEWIDFKITSLFLFLCNSYCSFPFIK